MSKLVKTLLQKKKTLVLIIGLGLFLSLIPLCFAQAGVWDSINNTLLTIATFPLRIAAFIVVLFLVLSGLVAGVFSFIAIAFLGWIKTICLTVPIVYSGVAQVGWNFTRDFANMFFILILAFIGLATILKLQEYQAKKTLPLLIIIALLINFSPVLVGFIVDISNIVTNFFLSQAGSNLDSWNLIWTNAKEVLDMAVKGFMDFDFMSSLTYMMAAMASGLALFIFYGFVTVIYFFVVILLITRIIFLWVLVILAPIAFISYIFPATKKLYLIGWDSWWEELVKWSIIGIPIGFFLYLSDWIMGNQFAIENSFGKGTLRTGITGIEAIADDPSLTDKFAELFTSMLIPFVAIVLLYLGVKFAKKLAPEMAIKIVDGVKKGVKVIAGTALAAATLGAGAGLLAGGLGKAAAGAAKAEAAMGSKRWAKPFQWAVGKPAKWATKGVARVTVPTLRGYEAKAREAKISQDFDKMSPDAQAEVAVTRLTREGRIQHFHHMREKGTLSKISEPKWKEIEDTIGSDIEALAGGPHYKKEVDELRKSLPNKVTAKLMIDFETDPIAKAKMTKEIKDMVKALGISDDDAAQVIITSKMKSEDIPKIASKKPWENKNVMMGMQEHWKGSQYRKGVERFEGDFVEGFMKPIEERLKEIKDLTNDVEAEKEYKAFIYQNPARARYLETTAAQELGFGSLYVMAPKVVQDEYQNIGQILAEKPILEEEP